MKTARIAEQKQPKFQIAMVNPDRTDCVRLVSALTKNGGNCLLKLSMVRYPPVTPCP
jgi:hypothetical protein